jgi:hypothetical protein
MKEAVMMLEVKKIKEKLKVTGVMEEAGGQDKRLWPS